ncbi:MAG: formylglycine-generating enzyme family protein [Acidobacteriota bacterium]|nr:formylglycine-generating enzyme family protein [Acidobacteriota bacterium]
MVVVPGGDFWMGRTRLWLIDEIGWQMRERMDDRPVHRVTLAPFSVDVHEVSNADFAAFVSATAATAPYHWAGTAPSLEQATLPVYNVSWHDAVAYCQWAGKRLPTEAEWEKAARGGMPDRDYPWGNDDQTDAPSATPDADTAASEPAAATRVTHAHSASATGPRPVGSFEPNGFGLYDMSGNVWEWVSDWYDLFYYAVSPIPNPTGPADGAYKVIRGGSWADTDPRLGAVYFRNFTAPELRSPTVGFRCARSVDPR